MRDEAHHDQLMGVVEALIDDASALESGPMSGLVNLISDCIREYEDRAHPWPDASTPATRLAFLMEQHVRKAWCLRCCPVKGI